MASLPLHCALFAVVALLITLTALVGLVTANRAELLRRVVVIELSRATGRNVHVGKVDLQLADGRLRVEELAIDERVPAARPMLAAHAVEVRFDTRWGLFLSHPLRAVRHITIDRPFAHLARDARGQWNIMELLRKKGPPGRGDTFTAEVVVRHGEVFYEDAKGWQPGHRNIREHATQINGRLLRGDTALMPFRVSALLASRPAQAVTVRGLLDAQAAHYVGEVRFGTLDLSRAQRYLPRAVPVTLTGGRADGRMQLVLDWNRQRRRWQTSMTMLADLHAMTGQLRVGQRQWPCRVADGQVRLAQDMVEFVNLRATVGEVPAVVNGTVSHFSDAVLALQVQTAGADAARLSRMIPGLARPELQWGGMLSGWAQVTGRARALDVRGHVQGATLRAKMGTTVGDIRNLRGDIVFARNRLSVSNLAGEVAGGDFSGQAWLGLGAASASRTAFLFHGAVRNVHAAELLRQFAAGSTGVAASRVSGTLSGPLAVSSTANGRVAVLAHAQGTIGVAQVTQGTVDAGVRLDLMKGRPAQVTLERVAVTTAEGLFRLSGEITGDRLRLAVQGSRLDVRAIGARFGRQDFAGTGYLDGTVAGTLAAPTFAGSVRSQDGRLIARKFAELSARVAGALLPAPRVTLQDLRLLSANRQVELTVAELTAAPSTKAHGSRQWQITRATLSRSRLSSLLAVLGVKMRVEGFVEGEITTADYPDGATGKGELLISRPRLQVAGAQMEFDRVTVAFSLRDAQTLDITEAKLLYEGVPGRQSVFTVHGRLSTNLALPPTEQLHLVVQGTDVPVDNLVTVAGETGRVGAFTPDGRLLIPVELQGHIDTRAEITGQLVAANGTGSAAQLLARTLVVRGAIEGGKNFTVAQVPYRRVAAALEYRRRDNTVRLTRFELSPGDAQHDYAVKLVSPSTLTLDGTRLIDLHLAVCGARAAGPEAERPADLAHLRRDLLAIAEYTARTRNELDRPNGAEILTAENKTPARPVSTGLPTVFANAVQYLHAVPQPFAGKMTCTIDVEEALERPVITTNFAITDLFVNGEAMPTVDASLSYDMAPRMLSIDRLVARGGIDQDSEVEVLRGSTITLPVKDAQGREIVPGPINLRIEAQNIEPRLFGHWFPKSTLRTLGGEMNISAFTVNNATTSRPQFEASLEWVKPVIGGVPFDMINAIVSLENDPNNSAAQRLSIGRETPDHSGSATVQLANSHRPGAKPLEVNGYVPFSWLRPMTPAIPRHAPFALNVRLPEQGLDVVKSYLPIFAKQVSLQGDGTLALDVRVGGTLANPAFGAKSFLLAKAPNLTIQGLGQIAPNRLHNMVVDLGFRSETRNGRAENIIEINDLSAVGDRVALPRPAQSFWGKLASVLGQRKAPPQVIPSVVAQGTIRLLPPAQGWPTLGSLGQQRAAVLAQCRYDIYAKALHVPLHVGKTYQGMLTSYLHLADRTPAAERPLLTGLVYLENSKVVYQGGQAAPFTMPQFPVTPDLSLFVQVGANNTFTIAPNNALLRGSILAVFPLTPTGPSLFPPHMVADPAEAEYLRAGGRPMIDRHPLHDLSPDFIEKQHASEKYANGSYGIIRGTLAKPEVEVTYVLAPRKSQVQLPGGLLVVQAAHGTYATTIGSEMPARLQVYGNARGSLDAHTVEAAIDGNLLQEGDIHNLITFTDTAHPSGERALGDSEIFARLIGVPDLVALVQGKERVFSPMILTTLGPNMLLSSWVRRLASTVNLETLSVGFDSTWAPEASLTTPEIGTTRWSAFRLGAARTFGTDPKWRLWLDYRIPNQRSWLRNVSVTGETNNLHENSLSLQYQLQFKTSPKK